MISPARQLRKDDNMAASTDPIDLIQAQINLMNGAGNIKRADMAALVGRITQEKIAAYTRTAQRMGRTPAEIESSLEIFRSMVVEDVQAMLDEAFGKNV
jgi:hypothetical protein